MSKFFATGSDDEDSASSSSDVELGLDKQQIDLLSSSSVGPTKFIYEDSSSDDEGKRVVRSEKDKRFDELQNTLKLIRNHLKISDWTAIQRDFDLLTKQTEKAEKVIKKEGVPTFLLSSVLHLDKHQKSSLEDKISYKKLAVPIAKSLNSLKQKIKKFISLYQKEFDNFQNDPNFQSQMATMERENKNKIKEKKQNTKNDNDDGDDEEEEDGEFDTKEKKGKTKGKKVKSSKKSKSIDDEEDDESDENGDGDDEDGDDDDNGDDSKSKVKSKKPKVKFSVSKSKKSRGDKSDDENDDDDEDDEEDDEDDGESSDSADDIDLDLATGKSAMFTRDFWVKKDKESESEEDDDDEKDKEERRRRAREEKKRREAAKEQASVEAALKSGQQASTSGVEMSNEQVVKKLKELLSMRGKRGTDRLAMIKELQLLATKATDPAALLKVFTTLASALFDVTLNKGTPMPTPLWQECSNQVKLIIDILEKNPQVRLTEDDRMEEIIDVEGIGTEEEKKKEDKEKESKVDEKDKDKEKEDDSTVSSSRGGVQYVIGNLYSFVQLLCLEFRRSLQSIDYHSEEFIFRLRDESTLSSLVSHSQEYYKKIGKMNLESNVAFLRLELIYYKYNAEQDVLVQKIRQNKGENKSEGESKEKESLVGHSTGTAAESGLVSQLATFLYLHGSEQTRVRALLLHVFHLALHNNWSVAREMLLMSHVHRNISTADIKTQILFNRAMAQLGLSAFRVGEFKHCFDSLELLVFSNKMGELLAQGLTQQKWGERDLEAEELQKRRKYPFHQHLNVDYIEATHLICAMLVEIPSMSLYGNTKGMAKSRAFRKIFDFHLRQAFTGSPENTKDIIIAAAKHLRVGEWEKAMDNILKLRFWRLLSEEIKEFVISQLKSKLQEEGLRTFLLSYSAHYSSISLPSLANMFSLEIPLVHRIASKLIVNEQLQGAWDEPTQTVQMHTEKSSKLQKSALAYADKIAQFIELNERMTYPQGGQERGQFGNNNNNQGGQGQQGQQGFNKNSSYVPSRGGRGRGGGGGGYNNYGGQSNSFRGRGRGGRGGGGMFRGKSQFQSRDNRENNSNANQ